MPTRLGFSAKRFTAKKQLVWAKRFKITYYEASEKAEQL